MIFKRNHNNDLKVFYIFLGLFGIVILILGITQSFWWNLLTFPLGIILIYRSIKRYRRQKSIITQFDFQEENIKIQLMDGSIKDMKNEQLIYAILVQKFIKPVRAIEIRQKRKINIGRGKLLGQIEVKNWDNIEDIARHLIHKDFKRVEWKFGWNWGDLLIIFGFLFGVSFEVVASEYISDTKLIPSFPTSQNTTSQMLGEIGSLMSDKRIKILLKAKRLRKNLWRRKKRKIDFFNFFHRM